MLENTLRNLIDHIREDLPSEGRVDLSDVVASPTGAPPLVIGLARFQSYRARTEAALVQELEDYIEEAGLTVLHFKVIDSESTVETVADGMTAHPTLSEAIKEAGLVALGRAIHLPNRKRAKTTA